MELRHLRSFVLVAEEAIESGYRIFDNVKL